MWCYQKPGFEALVLAELQRQQQRSQFCDTLLKAGDVAVPAHSCVLSAISPHVSSAVSSAPAPAAGQSRLLEFHALGACTLLHMVSLLYSGEMTGEGEKERQEAISAAANLGICGLVEVRAGERKSRGGQHMEVGVQTELQVLGEREGMRRRWRREVRDGDTLLWNETLSDGEKDMWTQTEEPLVNTAPSVYSASSFENTDMVALQDLAPSQIPCIPISYVYPPENQVNQPSSAPAASMQASTAAEHVAVAPPCTSIPLSLQSLSTLSALDLKSCWTAPQEAARDVTDGEEWQDEQFERFKGNIPEFISYFLNLNNEEGRAKGRAERRPPTTGAGSSERRPRRGRGGFMQKVDVQEVGMSRQQKMFLHKWGRGTLKTGQGGGTAGRKLHLKTRELLKKTGSCQKRRGCSKVWEFSQSREIPPYVPAGGGNTRRGRTKATLQSGQGSKVNSTGSVSVSSTSVHAYNLRSLSSSTLQPSPCPLLLSPAAPYIPPASSLLHTTPLPPPTPSPNEDQPEQIDRLLEEVMMGLDILPNNSNVDCRLPTSSSSTYVPSGDSLVQNKQQGQTSGVVEAGQGFHEFKQVVAGGTGASSSASAQEEEPVLQQQGGGELNKILDHFLQSFEQHIDNCNARETEEMIGESFTKVNEPHAVLNKQRKIKTHTMTSPCPPCHPQSAHTPRPVIQSQTAESPLSDEPHNTTTPAHTQQHKTSARLSVPPNHPEETPGDRKKSESKQVYKRRRRKKSRNQYLFSLETKRARVKQPVATSNAKTKAICGHKEKQLQQMPVVKLERSGMLPVRVRLQEHSCQSLEVKNPASKKTCLSSEKHPPGGSSSEKKQPVLWSTKSYPIRSRLRETNNKVSLPFFDGPHIKKQPRPMRSAKDTKNGQLLCLTNGWSSTASAERMSEKKEKQEKHDVALTVKPKEEAEGGTWWGKKRRAESGVETSQNATVNKRFCSEQTSGTWTNGSDSTDFVSKQETSEPEEVIDVETVSLRSAGDCLEQEGLEEKNMWAEICVGHTEEWLMEKDTESSGDEIVVVDGDSDGGTDQDNHTDTCHSRTAPYSVSTPARSAKKGNVGRSERCEDCEDIDVIGGDSPTPEPVAISWVESSEGEEEEDGDQDVDIVGETADCASLVVQL